MSNINWKQRGFRMLVPRKDGPSMPWSDAAPIPPILTVSATIRHDFDVGKASDLLDQNDQTPVVTRVRNLTTLV